MNHDRIGSLLRYRTQSGDDALTSQRWLVASQAKRCVYYELYGDLLESRGQRILDAGGGLTSLTRILAERHFYHLVETMVHDDPNQVSRFIASTPTLDITNSDWIDADFTGQNFDVVIANDLFPNVDQRIALFLDKLLPFAREIRMSVTYYNEPRYYKAKRLDSDEVFSLVAWNGPMTKMALLPYMERIIHPKPEILDIADDFLFDNKRQISIVTLIGDIA